MDAPDWKGRPFVPLEKMAIYIAIDSETARRYGSSVRAHEISNRDYKYRCKKHHNERAMRPPPSSDMHIYLGYLVVRKLGTPDQYETWMPVFRELYALA